jgi:hypothetical protein
MGRLSLCGDHSLSSFGVFAINRDNLPRPAKLFSIAENTAFSRIFL